MQDPSLRIRDVTDALMDAMEHAGEFDRILIIGQKKEGGYYFTQDGCMTCADAVWLMDVTKDEILKRRSS